MCTGCNVDACPRCPGCSTDYGSTIDHATAAHDRPGTNYCTPTDGSGRGPTADRSAGDDGLGLAIQRQDVIQRL